MLEIRHVSVRYGEKTAVRDVSFRVEEGQWWMLAGPNGAGKTSLAEAITRGVPYDGEILLDGVEERQYKTREYAEKVGMLSQINTVIPGYSVYEVVEMGRYAHRKGMLRGRDPEGTAKVEQAIREAGIAELRDRDMAGLSGGEIQRVYLAQVLAQDPKILILDEPANHLDLPFQQMLFGTVGEWLKSPGRAVITVTHDLTIAKKYGTRALLMHDGVCAGQGPAGETLTPENLEKVYGMDVYRWMGKTWNCGSKKEILRLPASDDIRKGTCPVSFRPV